MKIKFDGYSHLCYYYSNSEIQGCLMKFNILCLVIEENIIPQTRIFGPILNNISQGLGYVYKGLLFKAPNKTSNISVVHNKHN